MDRLVTALIVLAVLGGGVAVVRWRALDDRLATLQAAERRLAALEEEYGRLQRLPRDAELPTPVPDAAAALARAAETDGVPFKAVVRSGRGERPPGIAALRGEPIEIDLEPAASPLAALEWVARLSEQHPLLLTSASVSQSRLVLRGVVIGR